MAVVYLATQDGLDRTVAIKVLRKSLEGAGQEFKARFEHEGKMLAALEHENIVKIFDIGSTDEAVYMVMEYLKGGTLSHKMKAGELQLGDVIKICAQIGLALHAAHIKNIIHRDLKPSNIMFRDPVTPVLTDFGIARQGDLDLDLTDTGMMIGPPKYMSPEQIQGKPVDPRSDIYSLGLMMYKLLTGELPFLATDPIALAMQQIQEPPPPLPDHMSELQPVMDRMLAKDREDRYPDTLDFCNHLQAISLTGEEYATELSAATRIFSPSMLTDPISSPSSVAAHAGGDTGTGSHEASAVSKTFSSLGTAVSAVFTHKKPRRVMIGVVLAVVVGVFGSLFMLKPDISSVDMRKIERELSRFEAYMSLDQISSPVGENATESVIKLINISSEYGPIQDAAEELASIYEADAWDFYDNDDIDQALALASKGLEFAPENEGLNEIRDSVQIKVEERDRIVRIESLLASGKMALLQDNLLPPAEGNAYDAFHEVRTLDLQNEEAETGLSQIQRQIENQVRAAMASNNRDSAKALTLGGLEFFKDSRLLLDLKTDIENQERLEQNQVRLAQLLEQAEIQFVSGNIIEPPDNNALDSYQQAQELSPNDPAVTRGLEKIAQYYLAVAQTLFNDGAFQESLNASANGLRALPDHVDLLAAQSNATARLDAHAREIQTRLQLAERMIASHQFIPGQPDMAPGADNAQQAFNSVLEVDPENSRAREGLAALPVQIENAAGVYQRDRQFAKARGLLTAAQKNFQDAARFDSMIATLDQQIGEQAVQEKLNTSLAALDSLMETRPVTTDLVDSIYESLRTVSGEFPDQVAVSERLSRFITMIHDEAESQSAGGNDSDALALIDHSLILYPANTRLTQTRSTVRQRQFEREEAERERLAAISGVLAIDASPWGRVLEIRNSQQEVQQLPEKSDTPLFMTLVEGSYTIIVASADGASQVELNADVKRQQVQTVRTEAGLMSAQDYFERSGW
jgi:serine/threonine protein kinase